MKRNHRQHHTGAIAGLLSLGIVLLLSFAPGAAAQGIGSFGFGDFAQEQNWIESAPLPDGSTYLLTGTPFRLVRIGADGNPDASFGKNGEKRLATTIGGREVEWRDVFAAPDRGAILIGSTGMGTEFAVINRLLPDGRQNKSFGAPGPVFQTDLRWENGTVDASGRILLASSFETTVARLKPSGALDTSFGTGGFARSDLKFSYSSSYPYGMSAGNQGIYVVSYERTYRLTSDGHLDLSFGGGDGWVGRGGIRVDEMQDGVIIQSWNGHVERLLGDGTPDTSYGSNGTAFGGAANQGIGTLLEDGSLIFISPRGDESDRLYDVTRLGPDGEPDPNFAGDGRLEADWLDGTRTTQLWTIPGKGAALWGSQEGQGLVRVVDGDGNLDPGFGSGGIASIRTPLLPDADLTDSGQRKDKTVLTVGSVAEVARHNFGVVVASFGRNGKPEPRFGDRGRLVLVKPSFRTDSRPRLTLLPSGGAMICAKAGSASLVWKIDRNGNPDKGFAEDGRLVLPFSSRCDDISFDGTGAVLAAMEVSDQRGVDLIRIRTNGTLDKGYGVDGIAERTPMADGDFYWAYGSRLLTDRKGRTLLIASRGDARYISRYTRKGFPDESFGFEGKIHFGLDSVSQEKDGQKPIYLRGLGSIRGFAFGPGGSIYLTGTYAKRAFVAKLNSRGFPVKRYGKGGVVILPESGESQKPFQRREVHARAYGIAVRPNGSVIVTGVSRPTCSEPWGCSYPLMLKRVKPNGKVDSRFGAWAYRFVKEKPDATGKYVHFAGKRIVVTGSISFAIERRNFMLARFR